MEPPAFWRCHGQRNPYGQRDPRLHTYTYSYLNTTDGAARVLVLPRPTEPAHNLQGSGALRLVNTISFVYDFNTG